MKKEKKEYEKEVRKTIRKQKIKEVLKKTQIIIWIPFVLIWYIIHLTYKVIMFILFSPLMLISVLFWLSNFRLELRRFNKTTTLDFEASKKIK